MEALERLNTYLEAEQFHEAVTLALIHILPVGDEFLQEAAWVDRLRRLGYSTTVADVALQGCPFLLGCQQVVHSQDIARLAAWSQRLHDETVAAFLQGRGEPLSDWHTAQAVLACAEAALAARCQDEAALLAWSYQAARWFDGTVPDPTASEVQHVCDTVSFLTPGQTQVQDVFAFLARYLHIPTAPACSLTQWFYAPAQPREPQRRQKFLVPCYLERQQEARIAQLEMALFEGQGVFYADPVTMAFLQWDDAFATSYRNACTALRTLGYWRDDVEICWRLQADPPLYNLTGGSAGGAFFAALWHLLTGTPGDVSVTISAQITPEGHLLPVDHIQRKLLDAVLKDSRLSDVIVAAAQQDVDADAYHPLRIWKVSRAADPHRHGCSQ